MQGENKDNRHLNVLLLPHTLALPSRVLLLSAGLLLSHLLLVLDIGLLTIGLHPNPPFVGGISADAELLGCGIEVDLDQNHLM